MRKLKRELLVLNDHQGIFESELFGYEKGAFTDAKEKRALVTLNKPTEVLFFR